MLKKRLGKLEKEAEKKCSKVEEGYKPDYSQLSIEELRFLEHFLTKYPLYPEGEGKPLEEERQRVAEILKKVEYVPTSG